MPERLFQALRQSPKDRVLIRGHGQELTAGSLMQAVDALAARLERRVGVLAVLADNGPDWVVADLAALRGGLVHLPLPSFFTAAQIAHVLETTQADGVLTDDPARIEALGLGFAVVDEWRGMLLMRRDIAAATLPTDTLPTDTAKISFTSGSSGQPKGVCLSAAGLVDTAVAVAVALADVAVERHLCVLPLALLLENVAGMYAPLLRGAEVALPGMAALGWRGMSGFDPSALAAEVTRSHAGSVILVPALLKAWSQYLTETQQPAAPHLRFVAVGGARCDGGLLARARASGLPVYEGYGLTECGSVVSLNHPGADQPGSVGRALSHVRVGVDGTGEIRIRSRAFLGYLHDPTPPAESWPTGDLGQVDGDGFLHLFGRRKNLLITAYGRNVAPEWPEAALTAQPEIAQAVVTGDGRPWLAGVLVPAAGVDDVALARAVARANDGLPDYARVGHWITAAPFTPHKALATGNGRPRREAIAADYASAIAALYPPTETDHAFL